MDPASMSLARAGVGGGGVLSFYHHITVQWNAIPIADLITDAHSQSNEVSQ